MIVEMKSKPIFNKQTLEDLKALQIDGEPNIVVDLMGSICQEMEDAKKTLTVEQAKNFVNQIQAAYTLADIGLQKIKKSLS